MKRRELIGLGAAMILWPPAAHARQITAEGEIRVVVDPRIELMSIVHLLGQANTIYKAQARRYFEPFAGHAAVEQAKRLANDTLTFDAVPDLMLRLTAPNALVWRKNIPDGSPPGIPDAAQRAAFLAALRDFAKVSRFGTFFDSHRPLYRQVTATISPLVVQNVRALEDYSGGSLGHWQVVAGLLLHDGGFGPRLTRTDGTPETYAVIGPVWNSSDDPDFHDDDRLQELVVHEFAHSLVNPLAEANPAIVQHYASRFEPMRAAMNKVGEYDTWEIVVNEHIVRAVTARIAALRWGRAAGDAAVAREIARGFRYVPAIVGRLQTYEANRSQWPTLASYYAQLMEAFR